MKTKHIQITFTLIIILFVIIFITLHLQGKMIMASNAGSDEVDLTIIQTVSNLTDIVKKQEERHKHELICLEAKLRCELRTDKRFPCTKAYGDTLVNNTLIKNPKSCK